LCVEAKDRPTGGCSAEAMHEHDRLYIGGDWVAPATAGTIDIVSPHTEQVVGRVDNSMRIAREEIFGPVLSVIPYDGDDDAVQIAGDSEYDLAGSVWTADAERGHGIARRVRTGTHGVNTFTVEPSVPFGGLGRSGVGREGGPEGLAEYVETRAISAP
jgi:acyl-CoA reductase-like NAD-dependent aldehyde dehydrogenase